MSWLRFGIYSIGSLTTAILLLFITAYLLRLPQKTDETWYLAGYIGFLFLLLLAYLIRYSIFHHGGVYTGQMANLIVFAVICLIQFAYRYGISDRPREARLVLGISLAVGGLVWLSNFFRDLPPVYDFRAQYFTYEHGPRVSVFVLVSFLWALFVLLRKTVVHSSAVPGKGGILVHLIAPAGRLARSCQAFAVLTAATTVLSAAYLLFQAGLVSRALWALSFNTGSLVIALMIAIVYLNNSTQPSSFQAKVVGIPLATLMVSFGIVTSWMMPALNASLAERYAEEAQAVGRLLAAGVTSSMPSGVAYVVRDDDGAAVYLSDGLPARAPALIRSAEEHEGLLPAVSDLEPAFISLDLTDPATFFFFYRIAISQVTYRVGFWYADYRLAIHRFGARIATTVLASSLLVFFVFPLAFRRGLLRPVSQLMAAVGRVEKGDYTTQLPIPSMDEMGRLTEAFNGMVAAIHRAEEQLQTQQLQLMRADKLASIGVLVASVAHEVSNPNQVIRLNGRFLTESFPILTRVLKELDEDVRIGGLSRSGFESAAAEALQEVSEASERIQKIVGDLKDLTRERSEFVREPTDINAVVESVARLSRHFLRRATRNFQLDLEATLPPVSADRIRLEQVVLNLLQNAVAALPDPECRVWIRTFRGEGDEVAVEVGDEGRGIAPEDLARITDPFFTTRRASGGTGLGLSIADRIIRDHEGSLSFQSRVGGGTRAIVSLPLHP